MNKSPARWILVKVLVALFWLIPLPSLAAADVELLHSVQGNLLTDSPVEQTTAIQFDHNNALYALNGVSGELFRVQEGNVERVLSVVTAGEKKRGKLTGFSLLNDNSVMVVDAANSSVLHLALATGELLTSYGEKGKKAGMLIAPQDLAYSINKRIYIADAGNNEISVYSPSGIFLYALGQAETDPTLRLKKPTNVSVDRMERVYVLQPGKSPAIAIYEPSGKLLKQFTGDELKTVLGNKKISLGAMSVDEDGRMFLADDASGKILQFDWQTGKLQSAFGSHGEGPGQFREVTALAVSNNNQLAVLDSRNKKLDIYQLGDDAKDLKKRAWLPNIGNAEFLPVSCSTAYHLNDLNILCFDEKARQVRIIDSKGKTIHELQATFKKPLSAAFDGKHIVILDRNVVFVFNSKGSLLAQFGSSGRKDGELSDAVDVFLKGNRIYVAEEGNKRIQIFSLKGVYLDKLPQQIDKKNPLFNKPVAVAVDANGNLYVADLQRRKILVFSNLLEHLYEIGEAGESPGAFKVLTDLAIDTDNNLYVLTQTGLKEQTVQVYSGPEKVFEFGAYSKVQDTGIGKGVTLSVSPTSKTIVSVFDVIDPKNRGLISFDYLQVPPPVSGLEVAGGESVTDLSWQRVPGAYTTQYNVYASSDASGPFAFVKSVEDTFVSLEHEPDAALRYIRVSAVSGFGTEGPLSPIRENIFHKAKQQIADGELEQASELLQQYLQINPLQPRTHKLYGQVLMQQKRYTEAAESFKRIRDFEKYAVDGLNLQVEALYLNKDYAEAMALAQEAVKLAKDDVASYVNCGRLSLKIGDAVGAFICLEAGQKLDSKNTEILFLIAEAHIQLGTVAEGLKQLDKALAIDAKNAEAWARSGDIYLQLTQLKKAEQQYKKSLELNADHTHAQLGLAKASMGLKNWPQAKTVALKLAAKPESEASGNYLLGLMALEEKNPAQAIISLSKTSRAEPDNADAWLSLADAYSAANKPAEAIKSLQSAVAAEPGSFAALKRLGLLLKENKDFAAAANVLIQAEKINKKDFDVNFAATDALFKDKQYLQAAEYSQKAIAIKNNDTAALMLAADIAKQRGKIGEAIEYLKTAITNNKNDYTLHTRLGELYLENNLYEQAKPVLERASLIDRNADRAFVLLGNMFLSRRLFDQSIAAYEQAVKNNGNPDNKLLLDTAYAEKKRSLEFSSNAPQLVFEDLNIQPVFSAAYKQYGNRPVGSVVLRNVSGTEYGNLKVSFEVKGYMDFPTSQDIVRLAPNSKQEIALSAAFNNRILEIDEDTGVQVEIKLSYVREGRNDDISITSPMTIYGKNAMLWSDRNMIGSFVTPKDDSLRDFVRQAVNEYKPASGPLSENLVTAMTLFSAFSAHGIRYEIDPNNPFADLKTGQVDYVQFGRETLRLKSGDCDDLSVLFSAALENLGIETAIVDVPGHLLMMFNTNLPADQSNQISGQQDWLFIRDDKVWVPLEVTMIGTSFSEAWAEGAKKIQQHKADGALTLIPLKEAWQQYQPVTLKPATFEIKLPASEKVASIVQREQYLLLQKNLDQLINPYQAILAVNPEDHLARLQIAIIYARNGLNSLAMQELDELSKADDNNSAIHNNRGNIYLQQGDLVRAREAYEQAERLDPSDGGVKLNLAIVAYQQGEIGFARKKFNQATKLNQTLMTQYSTFQKMLKS
ncbi:MAG: tetratricopeptide repeat protein [Gammaproteobacteria bacterium]|nr:tetratricopeptide repeat protein [Gammaproteobacteria bacterium]